MASVDGLAPSKFGLKGRSLELLCIHGPLDFRRHILECRLSGRCVSIRILNSAFGMVPEVGIAPTSLRLQRSANLPQLLGVWFD
jgi:hypothetical protein